MGQIDLDAIRALHAQMEKKTKNKTSNEDFLKNFLTINEGKNQIRLLPSKDGKPFFAQSKIHRVTLPGQQNSKNVHCLKLDPNGNGKCPLCDLYFGLWKLPNKIGESLARKIKPTDRYYLNAISRTPNEDGSPIAPKILSIPEAIMTIIVNAMTDPDYSDVTDVATGNDFVIEKTMEKSAAGTWPKYNGSQFRPRKSPLGTKQEVDKWLSQLHDIHTLVKHDKYEEVEKMANELLATINVPESKPIPTSPNEVRIEQTVEEPKTTEDYIKVLKGEK